MREHLDLVGIRNLGDALNGGKQKAFADIKDLTEAEGALIKARIEEGEIHKKDYRGG